MISRRDLLRSFGIGTAAATAELVTKLGGVVVECVFVIELSFLRGREKLQPHPVYSIIQYDSE